MAEGPELIINGDFPSNVNNWTAHINGGSPISPARGINWVSNRMLVRGAYFFLGPPGFVNSYQNVVGLTGNTDYIMRFDVKVIASPDVGAGGVSTSATSTSFTASACLGPTGVKEVLFTTGPGVTSIFAKIYQPALSGNNNSVVEVDDISMKEYRVPKVIFF